MRAIDGAELGRLLAALIERVAQERPVTADIFQLLFNTGLRVNEVLEVERWQPVGQASFTVQLSKREETRQIHGSNIPAGILHHYVQQQPYYLETYSAVNNTFKHHTPGIVIRSKKKSTLLHAFRYYYIKQLYASGMTLAEVAEHMGHKVQASTAGYILAQVEVGS